MRKPELINREIIFSNPKITIVNDKLRYVGGEELGYIYLKRPDACLVIPSCSNGKFYMINQYRYPSDKSFTQFPLESQEEGENPLICAKRGLEEETGLRAKKWSNLGSFYTDPGTTSQQCYVFLAEELEKGTVKHESTENIKVVILTKREIEDLIKSIQVEGWTIAAWNLYLQSLLKTSSNLHLPASEFLKD